MKREINIVNPKKKVDKKHTPLFPRNSLKKIEIRKDKNGKYNINKYILFSLMF